jgi:hypothetical protein
VDPRASATIAAAQKDEPSRRREAEVSVVQGLKLAGWTEISRSKLDELVDEALAKSTEQPASLEEAVILLDWIGAGSGFHSSPIQSRGPRGSWISNADPVPFY